MKGHLDGIGVYSRFLWQTLHEANKDIHAAAFGVRSDLIDDQHALPRGLVSIPLGYPWHAACSVLTGCPFQGSARLGGNIDLFHAPDHCIPKLRHVPVVATIMDAIPLIHPEWASSTLRPLKNFAFRRAARWAQQVITISEFSERDIVEAFGLDEKRVTVTHLGFDEAFLVPQPEPTRQATLARHGLRPGFFLFVGTLQPRKNIRRIIAAHRALPLSLRTEHPLVIVGQYGWGEPDLLSELADLENEGKGRWLRFVPSPDLFALMQSARALVSRWIRSGSKKLPTPCKVSAKTAS